MSLPNRFDSTETGAPVLNNVTASLLAVLRACLKDGFNVKGITGITVTSEVATVQCPTHGYACGYAQLVRITGASVPALDGDKQPTLVDANYFSFPAPGVADGSYTATDARRAPLGWTEPHTGTNRAIFARTALEALPHMVRVVDDGSVASIIRVKGIASAIDIDTYTGDFPSEAQIPGGAYWQRGTNNSTPKRWVVVGCDRGFYVGTELATSNRFVIYWFGDIIPFYAGDVGATLLSGQVNATYTDSAQWRLHEGASVSAAPVSNQALYAPTGVLPAENAPVFQSIANPSGSTNISGYSGFPNATNYPNPVIHQAPYVVSTGPCIRGQLPGLAYILSAAPFSNLQIFTAGAATFVALSVGGSQGTGQIAINLSGGWY